MPVETRKASMGDKQPATSPLKNQTILILREGCVPRPVGIHL
jgi:hypothetical protein